MFNTDDIIRINIIKTYHSVLLLFFKFGFTLFQNKENSSVTSVVS